jgi:hypothetical protein
VIDWKVIVTGLICITIIESIALMKGINGTLLTLTIGAICGVIGWRIPMEEPIKKSIEVKL